MSRSVRLLAEIAAAVADGESTDWGQAARKLSQEPEASRAAALKLVASLGREGQPPPGSHGTAHRLASEAKAPLMTLRALLILVGAQVLCAVMGFFYEESRSTPVPPSPVLLTALSFAGGGVVLLYAGRRDRRALVLGAFFLCIASASSQRFLVPAASGSSLGAIIPMLAAWLPETFLPFFLWRFVREFPRVLRLDRLASPVNGAVLVSGALGWVLFSANAVARLLALSGHSAPALWAPLLRQPTGLYWLLLSALCLPAPLVAWVRSRHADADEQRRVRLFLSGLALGILPLFVNVLAEALSPSFERMMSAPVVRSRAAMVLFGLLLTIPVTTTYATVAHRLLDVRLLLRRAARLAFARRSVAVLGILPSLLLLLHLYRQRGRPLESVVTERHASALLVLAAAGWALFAARKSLLGRIEGLLVAEGTNPALVLASFAHDAQAAHTVGDLGHLVRRWLGALVGAEHAAMLFYDPATHSYASLERRIRPLSAGSAFATLIAAAPEPAELVEEERDSLASWLIEEDRSWIADAEAHLAAPVLDAAGSARALLILGPTRSALPYTRDEQRAITAFASTTSLALERLLAIDSFSVPDAQTVDQPAGECRVCARVASRPAGVCLCGSPLTPAHIPYELAGKFRLEAILGQGGMGVVYRATDLTLNRTVALKTLPHLDSTALVRLRREARSMAGFLHPNLALIFGLETWRGVPVLVVEYLAGGSLAARLGGFHAAASAVKLGVALAAGLEAMHDQELLHRDVKPSNIGFAADGTPKLLDFGLSRLVEEAQIESRSSAVPETAEVDPKLRITLTGHVVGTPLYMSPEALDGASPSPSQDLWSLHLVIWEALAGRHPCAGLSLEAALGRLARGELPDLRTVRPDCPPALTQLLARGLDPVLRLRLQTAASVRQSFVEVLGRGEVGMFGSER